MRNAFFSALMRAAAADDRVHLVTGDLGFGVVEPFVDAFPEQFVNAGVAEQNMTSLAAGLALSGAKVFTYSIGNFPTLRCLEQIRFDVAYHEADVTVVAIGGGLAYGALGVSHHATEDLAVMRSIPNLRVAAPGDPVETVALVEELVRVGGPAYLRLGKAGEPVVHSGDVQLPVGSCLQLRDGQHVALMTTGGMLPTGLAVADELAAQGVTTRLLSVPWLRPLDEGALRAAADQCQLLVTLEEHTTTGGLGGAVAEVVSGLDSSAPLQRLGLPAGFTSVVGSQDFLRRRYGLDTDSVVARIRHRLGELDRPHV